MDIAILFWCHNDPTLCANRLRMLRHYNPGAPIYVLFGGSEADAPAVRAAVLPYIDDFYVFAEERSPQWKRDHGDMLISRWHLDRGRHLRWESLAVIQWDMLAFAPVGQLFEHLRRDDILLAGTRPVTDVKPWNPWIRPEYRNHRQYADFLAGYRIPESDAWFCPFMVAVLPRAFLDRFSERANPETGYLEYTMPTLAKAWGFRFCEDHPYAVWGWHGARHAYHKMLNTNKVECTDRYVLLHLLDPAGIRIFHPYSRDLRTDALADGMDPAGNFLRCLGLGYADVLGETPRPAPVFVTGRPSICLAMLVRDEAHRAEAVEAAVDRIAPHISSWVLVDAGSDTTADRIARHLAGLGIPGERHQRPWRNYGHNRTEALSLAQGRADYVWVVDAGDTLLGTPDFARLGAADIYFLRYAGDGPRALRPQVFRDGVSVRYVGVTDEPPGWDDPYTNARLDGDYRIDPRPPEAADPREVLLAEFDANPADALSALYLAHWYFESGDFAAARTWYARRAGMGGWDVEVYVALWRLAESMARLGEPWPQVRDAYLQAWEFRPTRAEPLFAIATLYRGNERYLNGYQFARLAAEIPEPEADIVDVGAEVYAWRALDEQAVCAHFLGRGAEAFALWRRALARPGVPEEERRRMAANRDVAVPAMIEAASAPPAEPVPRAASDASVTVSLLAGPDREAAEQTLNSLLRSCLDASRAGRWLVLDAGLPAADRARLQERYGFLEFVPAPDPASVRAHIGSRFWLRLDAGWRLFAPDHYITLLTAVLEAEPDVVAVGINYGDAAAPNGTCAPGHLVRRAADSRYVLCGGPSGIPRGPVMFDTGRLDRAGGFAAPSGLRIATLDEVLCVGPGVGLRAS